MAACCLVTGRVDVLWRCAELRSTEHFSLEEVDGAWVLSGDASLLVDGIPGHVGYRVAVSADWVVVRALIDFAIGGRHRVLEIMHAQGAWTVDGIRRPDLAGCTDVDLGWTPSTNTVPLRRLSSDIGERREVRAAWVRFPELDVQAAEQCYTRLASDRWRYQAGPYEFVLVVSEEGLVLEYGDDLWRADAVVRTQG